MKNFFREKENPLPLSGAEGGVGFSPEAPGLVLHEHRGRLRLLEAEEGAGDKLLRIRCASVRPGEGYALLQTVGGCGQLSPSSFKSHSFRQRPQA